MAVLGREFPCHSRGNDKTKFLSNERKDMPRRKNPQTLIQQALLNRLLPVLGRRGIQYRLRAQRAFPKRLAPEGEIPYQTHREAGTFRRRNAMMPLGVPTYSLAL